MRSLNKAAKLVNTNYILYAHDDMFFCKNWDVFLKREVKILIIIYFILQVQTYQLTMV